MPLEYGARGGVVSPGWFAVAAQALVFLDQAETVAASACSSAEIAEQVRAHAVFLRRVLAPLVRAGIVEAREGRDGGYLLARPASQITLADVYRALKDAAPGEMAPEETLRGPTLPPGTRMALDEVAAETEESMLRILEQHTIASLAARAKALDNQGSCH